MIDRSELEKIERKRLKPYSCFSDTAKRYDNVKSHPLRTNFQRDRDRIIHSKAFRRLEYKTQVYLSTKSDHMRTRLTHSLEVSQIGRTIATQLGLNTDLVEAISLGHDVGHTPFGHAAERKLNEILKADGLQFKHNMQSVRIFEELEKKYQYKGLRLTIPVLEGIVKHTKFINSKERCFSKLELEKEFSFTLEGQVVAIADEIAQITHDTDDYLRTKIIKLDRFLNHKIFKDVQKFCIDNYSYDFEKELKDTGDEVKRDVIIRCLVDFLVSKLIEDCSKVITNDLRAYEINKKYIDYCDDYNNTVEDFHKYLNKQCFEDYGVNEMDRRGKEIVSTLYDFYKKFPKRLPEITLKKFESKGNVVIADYISGMTDRYAISRYNSIIDID